MALLVSWFMVLRMCTDGFLFNDTHIFPMLILLSPPSALLLTLLSSRLSDGQCLYPWVFHRWSVALEAIVFIGWSVPLESIVSVGWSVSVPLQGWKQCALCDTEASYVTQLSRFKSLPPQALCVPATSLTSMIYNYYIYIIRWTKLFNHSPISLLTSLAYINCHTIWRYLKLCKQFNNN